MEITGQTEIDNELTEFFEHLYTTEAHTADPSYLKGLDPPKLNAQERQALDKVIDLDEIKKV